MPHYLIYLIRSSSLYQSYNFANAYRKRSHSSNHDFYSIYIYSFKSYEKGGKEMWSNLLNPCIVASYFFRYSCKHLFAQVEPTQSAVCNATASYRHSRLSLNLLRGRLQYIKLIGYKSVSLLFNYSVSENCCFLPFSWGLLPSVMVYFSPIFRLHYLHTCI